MSQQEKRKPIRISVEEAKKRYDEDGATILDVVDPGTYERLTSRIQDAVRIDPRQIDEEFEQLPQEYTIFAYCT